MKVKVRSTLGGTTRDGWIYLFKRSGSLSPGAGESYVDYDFQLLSGAYKTTYKLQDGPNPENTTVTTPFYVDHFSDRWLNDQIQRQGRQRVARSTSSTAPRPRSARASAGAPRTPSTTPRARSSPTGSARCGRSAPTSAPTAARSPSASTSSTSSARTSARSCACTRSPGRGTSSTTRRRPIGMTYRNNLNTGGVRIDGTPDTPTDGALTWETVDGPQGGLSMAHSADHRHPGPRRAPRTTSTTARPGGGAETQCTGDAQAYRRERAVDLHSNLPNTDPRTPPFNSLQLARARSTSRRRARPNGAGARARRPAARSSSPSRAFP